MPEPRNNIETELLEECGFWKWFSGQDRRIADSVLIRWYWFFRALWRSLALVVRFAFAPRNVTERPVGERAACDVLLIYLTHNQKRAMLPWIGQRREIQTASWMAGADWHISWFRCGTLSLRFLWPVYRLLRSRSDYELTLPWLEEFVRYRVGVVLADELYRKSAPRSIAVSNDHSGIYRAFLRVARDRGYATLYTQHASVGSNFPRLNFDLALLDGIQAYSNYVASGMPKGEILITGRTQVIARRHERASAHPTVGLATNWTDPFAEWIPMMIRIRRRFPDVLLRCHPAETRKPAWRLICFLLGIRMDSGSLDNFLNHATVVVSGMSGIILDAALHGIPCLINVSALHSAGKMADYFGYQAYGLCKRIATLEGLPRQIEESIAEGGDFERAGVYEAGLVQDPVLEKRIALEIFVASLRENCDLESRLRLNYLAVQDSDFTVFMTRAYTDLAAKHGWLPASHAARPESKI